MVLGIDIGGRRTKAAMVSEAGETLASGEAATDERPDKFAANLESLVRTLQKDRTPVRAVGFGCKGIVDAESTEVLTLPGTLHFLEGRKLSDLIAAALPRGCPVTADNDARAALAGEREWGAAKGLKNALFVTLGTGVGGGVIANGEILRGAFGIAGHIGHVTADPDGPECICGNRGCLETFFSAAAIESAAEAAVRRGLVTKLRDGAITCEAVFRAAEGGDRVAAEIIAHAAKYLGGSIAALVFVLDPEKVILSGQITEAGDALFEPLAKDVHARTLPLLRRKVPIVKSQLSDPSGTLGAAALALGLEVKTHA